MIAPSRPFFVPAGFNPGAFGTVVGWWDADDASWSGSAAPGDVIPSRQLGGPNLLTFRNPVRSASGWPGTPGGSQVQVRLNTDDALYAQQAPGAVPSPLLVGVWNVPALTGFQSAGALEGTNDLHWFAGISGPANIAEVTGAGNAGTQAPLFSTGLHVIAMQMLSGTDFRGYIDGVQAYAWNGVGTLINPLSRFIYGQKGINQQGYAFGSYWRAGALYSAITASVADICAAFAAEYV